MTVSIRTKLFAALLVSSAVVSVTLFLFLRWSFTREFLAYVNQQQQAELEALSERLADLYGKNGSWEFLRDDPQAWHRVLRAGARDGRPGAPVPPPPPPPGRGGRVALFDAEKRPILGPPDLALPGRSVPVLHGGRAVGYLATVPLRELTDAADILFVQRQTRAFALISLVAAGFSLLLSFPLANHLLRPIRSLSAATRELASGRYGTRVPPASADELGRLCEDFNELARTLEANETARRQWVADIAHELRTPLAILRGEIEAMQDGVRSPDPAGLRGLHGEVLRLARLVDDLYELSLSDLGALTYKKRPVDVVGLLEETLELVGSRLEAAGLTLETSVPAGPALLTADPDRLRQLFENLLENSLRYTAAPGTVRVRAAAAEGRVEIAVEDSAPRVEEDQLDRLFERLYRGEGSRNRATGGAGLGLTICKNIVEAHGGTIEAEASDLGGLRIRVRFPLERRAGA